MRIAARAVAATALIALTGMGVSPAFADGETDLGNLTVLATTDVHGHAVDYDYFTGESFGAKKPKEALGMDHLATAINDVRAEVGADTVLTLDNGDTIQGSPLDTYYQAHRTKTSVDPMAAVLNYLKYDAVVTGNHEYNYGMDNLDQYRDNLDMPLLAANAINVKTGKPYLDPYVMLTRTIGGKEVKIGVIGLVTPGVRVWDKANVEGILKFEDEVEVAQKLVPEVRKAGADVVIILSHSGLDAEGYKWNPADLTENVSRSLAEHTSGVDLIIGGHSHVKNKGQVFFTNAEGKKVLFTQPYYWARSLAKVTLPLVEKDGKISVSWDKPDLPNAVQLLAPDYAPDPKIKEVIEPYHDETVQWVKTVVAQSTEEMSAATSSWEDTPIVDFINKVQTDELVRAMKGTEYEKLPVISQASPFSRTAIFRKGDVTIADMAALYIYDNTLYGVILTGKELRDYLEFSARYYTQQPEGAVITDWTKVTNAIYPGKTRGIPDYSYDELSGVNYHINISKAPGERIENLTMPDGTPVTDDMKFVLAVNNYRWSGGSGYPHVTTAPVVYNDQKEIREMMINWAMEKKVINPADFFVKNWTVSTSAAPKAPAPAPADKGGELAKTGADSTTLAALSLLLMALGGSAVMVARRR